MNDIFESLAHDPALLIPIIAIGGGFLVAIIAIAFGTIKGISSNCERQKSLREIAAYIAEGSMTPEEGERLMNASRDSSS